MGQIERQAIVHYVNSIILDLDFAYKRPDPCRPLYQFVYQKCRRGIVSKLECWVPNHIVSC